MTWRETARRAPALAAVLLLTCGAAAQESRPDVVFREGLVLDKGSGARRAPFSIDPVSEAVVRGTWKAPPPGEKVTFPDGASREWTPVKADGDGWISHDALRHGYASFVVQSDVEEVRVLDATGHSMVYVNGEPRAGDPYQYGFVKLPVLLVKGANAFLFACERNGKMRATLTSPRAPLTIEADDPTLPDLVDAGPYSTVAAVIVQNNTSEWSPALRVESSVNCTNTPGTDCAPIPPLTRRKVKVRLPVVILGDAPVLTVTLRAKATNVDTRDFDLQERTGLDVRTLTFTSAVDGSVQRYAVKPGEPDPPVMHPRGLVLSLHGAGVDAVGQAASYSTKKGMHIVAPTNRRPYGFDWEDWGRLDALEVLEHASARYSTDRRRVWLTGHSMGGHGAWQLGALFPDRFAVVAPSAGWRSFFTYGGVKRGDVNDPLQEILGRAVNSSDTGLLTRNHALHAVYLLHGDKDDNVPVSESRAMREELAPFRSDVVLHEEPGAGHWWGNACVDWPPIFEKFRSQTVPLRWTVPDLDFTTVDPGLSGTCYWVSIDQQEKRLAPSRVQARADVSNASVRITTENVAGLTLAAVNLGAQTEFVVGVTLSAQSLVTEGGSELTIDGEALGRLSRTGYEFVCARRVNGKWSRQTDSRSAREKGRLRSGPFKDAFRNRFLYVVGTKGTPEENAWALARARYDAETFWVRGNGSVDIVLDKDFDPERERDRSVILVGNADTNRAWKALLGKSPLQVTRDAIRVGDKTLDGGRLGAYFVRPRAGSDVACVAVIGGTGIEGMRLTLRMPIFVSGVAYPDWCVVGPSTEAPGGYGFVAAGFFSNDWSVNPADSAFAPGVK